MAALATWTVVWAWASWDIAGLSWHFFAEGGQALTGESGLQVYSDHPTLQIGPLALVVGAALESLPSTLAQDAALALMALVGPAIVVLLFPLANGPRRMVRVALGTALFIPAWMVLAVRWGHLDDVLAMLAAVVAVRAVHRERPVLAGVALAAAVAAKPWAVGFVPILLGLQSGRIRASLLMLAGGLAAWLPFVVAAPGTVDALRPQVPLIPGSGLDTLGVQARFVPSWGRTAQLVAAPAVGLVVALRGRWPGVLLAALATRLALDPQDNPYYVGSAAAAALVFDLVGTRWIVPWATLLTVVMLWQPFVPDYEQRFSTTTGLAHWWFAHPTEVGWVHLAWSVGMIALILVARPPAGSRVTGGAVA